jgi:aminoglycoside 6'-N-acetyltransferase I
MTTRSDRADTARTLLERANQLLEETRLLGLLKSHFGEAVVTGSAGYDLMVWPDIDIHMPVEESRNGEYAMLGGEISARLATAGIRLHRAQFLDDYVDPDPLGAGLYWGLEFRDRGGTPWKCDLWGWERADFRHRQKRDETLRDALAKADRDLILRLKTEARERPNFYGVVVGSFDLYRFAIAHAGSTIDELVDWVRSTASQQPTASLGAPAPGTVQRLTIAEIDAWSTMRGHLFPREAPDERRKEIAEILKRDSEAGFAARAGDAWIGFIELRERSVGEGCETSPVGYIEALWVAPDLRRRGVARQLVGAALDWCRDRGLRELCSDTQIDNVVSQAVHRRFGFAETERLVTYRMKVPPG